MSARLNSSAHIIFDAGTTIIYRGYDRRTDQARLNTTQNVVLGVCECEKGNVV